MNLSDSIRTSKTVGSTRTECFLNGSQILAQKTGSNVIPFYYDANGTRIAFKYNGTMYYYVYNLQGDVTHIIDATGAIKGTYQYDAWGNILNIGSLTTIAQANPFRYRGYYYDNESGFYYLNSRYYNPEWGRFINADDQLSIGDMTGMNLFAYCDNNPVMRTDHGGDFWHIVVGTVAGALIGGIGKAVSNAIEKKSLTDGLTTAMLTGAASGALASTSIGIVGMVVGTAAISMAENAATQIVENKGFNNFDISDMLIDGAIGGVSGAMGGAGKGTKHLTNLGKQTVKRTFNTITNKGIKSGLKEAGKAFAYYGKNSAKYYKNFVNSLPGDFISTVGVTIASSNYMKYQYRIIFGR